MSSFIESVNRLKRIDWEKVGTYDKASNVALVREYIRRASLFKLTFSIGGHFPIFSAAYDIGKDINVDINSVCPALADFNNHYMWHISKFYLEWATLIDEEVPEAIQFRDLYDPLIMMYQRGGMWYPRKGEVNVGSYSFPLIKISEIALELPIDISESVLEKLDHEYK